MAGTVFVGRGWVVAGAFTAASATEIDSVEVVSARVGVAVFVAAGLLTASDVSSLSRMEARVNPPPTSKTIRKRANNKMEIFGRRLRLDRLLGKALTGASSEVEVVDTIVTGSTVILR